MTLDVHARKVAVDSAGAEGGEPGKPLYLRRHRVLSGEQRITVTVPGKPARAGIDPRSLLIDVEATDNLRKMD